MAKQFVIRFHKFWGSHYPGEEAAFSQETAEALVKRGTAELVRVDEGAPAPTAGAVERLRDQETRGAKGKDAKNDKGDA